MGFIIYISILKVAICSLWTIFPYFIPFTLNIFSKKGAKSLKKFKRSTCTN